MDKNLTEIYSKGYKHGYFAGYQAAIEDAMQGRRPHTDRDIYFLPIEATELSSRAKNCLHKAGCKTVGNILDLGIEAVSRMRNLGNVTGKEIAKWLDDQGLPYTAWNQFI